MLGPFEALALGERREGQKSDVTINLQSYSWRPSNSRSEPSAPERRRDGRVSATPPGLLR